MWPGRCPRQEGNAGIRAKEVELRRGLIVIRWKIVLRMSLVLLLRKSQKIKTSPIRQTPNSFIAASPRKVRGPSPRACRRQQQRSRSRIPNIHGGGFESRQLLRLLSS